MSTPLKDSLPLLKPSITLILTMDLNCSLGLLLGLTLVPLLIVLPACESPTLPIIELTQDLYFTSSHDLSFSSSSPSPSASSPSTPDIYIPDVLGSGKRDALLDFDLPLSSDFNDPPPSNLDLEGISTSDTQDQNQEQTCQPTASECLDLEPWTNEEHLNYPLILVHGFFGWTSTFGYEYFYEIPEVLKQAGYSVYLAQMDPIQHSQVRSQQLAHFVDRVLRCTCAQKVNLIGHSQGGIDARFLIGPLGREHQIESITTISSPHLGFQLADEGASQSRLGLAFVEGLTGLLARVLSGSPQTEHDLQATLRSMSVAERTEYNQMWPDPPSVPIYSYAGFTGRFTRGGSLCAQGQRTQVNRGDWVESVLWFSYRLLGGSDRLNDGIVPTASCIWGQFLGCIAADHFDQIGQIAGLSDFDYIEFYLGHAQFLKDRGH